MAALRTQVYLTTDQRRRLDDERRRRRTTLATIVREAIDAYLAAAPADPAVALDAAFGAAPGFAAPDRGEWSRG